VWCGCWSPDRPRTAEGQAQGRGHHRSARCSQLRKRVPRGPNSQLPRPSSPTASRRTHLLVPAHGAQLRLRVRGRASGSQLVTPARRRIHVRESGEPRADCVLTRPMQDVQDRRRQTSYPVLTASTNVITDEHGDDLSCKLVRVPY